MSGGGPARDLTGRVVIVTGATQGIGEATARLCAERGAAVVLADANAERGEVAAAGIWVAGRIAHFVRTDVRDDAQVAALVAETLWLTVRAGGERPAGGLAQEVRATPTLVASRDGKHREALHHPR